MIIRLKIPLFCKHDYEFDSTIHGDMIIQMSYNRSIWKCCKCGKYTQRKEYVSPDKQKVLQRLKKIKKLTQ